MFVCVCVFVCLCVSWSYDVLCLRSVVDVLSWGLVNDLFYSVFASRCRLLIFIFRFLCLVAVFAVVFTVTLLSIVVVVLLIASCLCDVMFLVL